MHLQYTLDNTVNQNRVGSKLLTTWEAKCKEKGSLLKKKMLNYNQMAKHDSQYDLTLCHQHHTVVNK